MVLAPPCARAVAFTHRSAGERTPISRRTRSGLASSALATCLFGATLGLGGSVEAQLGCLSGGVCDEALVSERLVACTPDCASGICADGLCIHTGMCPPCLPTTTATCPELRLVRGDGTLTRLAPIAPSPTGSPRGCAYALCSGHEWTVGSGGNSFSDIGPTCTEFDGGSSWRLGDCDGDGLTNPVDPVVCEVGQKVMVRGLDGLACVEGSFGDVCPGGSVAPGVAGCAADGAAAFAVCCMRPEDCPSLPRARGRCVILAGTEGHGACLYDESIPAGVDTSCGGGPVSDSCWAGRGTQYSEWANGNCDGACGPNAVSASVCGCGMDLPDAFVAIPDAATDPDAGVMAEPDAALDPDAAVRPDEDAGGGGALDAGAEPRVAVTFAGSGCRCSARRAEGPGWLPGAGTLAITALVVSRRRSAKRRAGPV